MTESVAPSATTSSTRRRKRDRQHNDDDDDDNDKDDKVVEEQKSKEKRRKNNYTVMPSNIINRHNRKFSQKSMHKDVENEEKVEPMVKPSKPGLLKEMSARNLEDEALSQSMFSFVVVRECELLIETYRKTGKGDGITTARDVERVERRADDFVFVHRPTADNAHRKCLWVARCKLVTLREVMQRAEKNETATSSTSSSSTSTDVDQMRFATRFITEEMLAKWMAENSIGDESVVRINPRTNQYEHAIGRCGLSALWLTIRSLRDRWDRLPLSPYLYVIIERLRSRVAFYMGYRELVNEKTEREREFKSVKILGLSRSSWRAADPEWVEGSRYDPHATHADEMRVDENASLLNSSEFTKTTVSTDKDARQFCCVNDDFIEETERTINAMLIELRKCAGFEWHENFDESECDCHACSQLTSSRESVTLRASAIEQLEKIVTEHMKGNFKDYVQMEFRKFVWDGYIQPGEQEMFAIYRPLDSQKAQSVISRGRPSDGKNISRRLCEREAVQVWADFTTKATDEHAQETNVLIDYTQKTDPSYSLLQRLTLGFYLDSMSNGGRFVIYTIDCHMSNKPFKYSDERFGKHRNSFEEFHTPVVTTGTLCWRYKYQRRVGLRAPPAETYYEHPMILRTMASFCVLYNGRMHLCENFAEAFVVWVTTMCEDPKIGGETYTDFSLFSLYEFLFPSRKAHIATLRHSVDKRKQKWDPLSRLFPQSTLKEKPAVEEDTVQY